MRTIIAENINSLFNKQSLNIPVVLFSGNGEVLIVGSLE